MTQEEYDGQEEVQRAVQEDAEGGPAQGMSMEELEKLEEALLTMHKGTVYESVLPPDKFEYVKLPNGRHFLVLNGFRGPVGYQSQAAWHPQGFAYFSGGCYHCATELKGKLVQVLTPGENMDRWHGIVLTLTDESVCEIADKAYKEYSELSAMCADIKAARYPEAAANAVPETEGDNDILF